MLNRLEFQPIRTFVQTVKAPISSVKSTLDGQAVSQGGRSEALSYIDCARPFLR